MLRVGETVGPYEILARLKAGGMATLFVGQKRGAAGFSRHVAIKVVHEHLQSDPDFVRMFVDEALLQARIHHPNVVHVEELGEAAVPGGAIPVHYLVMEYVYGCSLAQMLDALARRDRRISPELAVHIAIQTLSGLHAAHELKDEKGQYLGVVHRDVSPQNVLLAYEGHVKLIDFGVAKARNRSQQTTGASLKGKIRYMPPEQAMGVSAIDRRADVYALGIILWEMLTFRKLFHAKDDLVLLDQVRNPRVLPPSRLSKDVPPAVDAVVMKALAPKVEDRWATAQEFRRALAEAMPKAMLVDASNVADLLVAVMSEQMKKDREALPSQLSAVMAGERRAENVQGNEEVLMTMTISAAGRAYLEELSIDVDAPSLAPSASLAPPIVAPIGTPTRPLPTGSSSGSIPASRPARSSSVSGGFPAAPPASASVSGGFPAAPAASVSGGFAAAPPASGDPVRASVGLAPTLTPGQLEARQVLAATHRELPHVPPPAAPAPAAGGSRLPLVLGVIALVLVTVAAGAWWTLRGQDQTVARSLDPADPSVGLGTPPPSQATSIQVTPPPDTTTIAAPPPTAPIAPPPTAQIVAPPPTAQIAAPPPSVAIPTPPPTSAPPPTTRVAAPPPSSTAVAHPVSAPGERPPPSSSTRPHGTGRTGSGRRPPPSSGGVPLADEW
ncbi:MAG: protein kinase [Sandaracinus sp.]